MKALFLFLALLALPAQAELGLHLASHLGYGKLGSDNNSVKDRSMGVFDIQAMPGYRMGMIMGGILVDYRSTSQLTNEQDVGGNYRGSGINLGLGAEAGFGPIKALISYDFRSRHNLTGTKTTYMGSGFRLGMGYQLLPKLYGDIQFSKTTFKTVSVDGSDVDLGSNAVSHWNLGFGISLCF